MTIALDLYRDLPKVRAAFDAGELQAQTNPKGLALYDGPCAIGVMLTLEQRKSLVGKNEGISRMFGSQMITAPEEQQHDLIRLQIAHDNCMTSDENAACLAEFARTLESLEAEYAAAEVKS